MGSSPLHPAPLLREPQTVQKRHPDRIQPLFLCLGRTAVCGAHDFSVLLNYGFGRLVEKFGKKRWLLALCVTLNLLILGYFKYYNFLAEVLNPLLRGFDIALPAIQVTLPIGISFYTFQALSYVVDVYRGENQAQKNPLNMMLYISFFPQLIAG